MAIKGRLRFEILRRDGHLCKYCGYGPPDVKLTVDHVVPTVLGGTDDPTNLVTACSKCNGGKASIMPDSPFVAQAKDDAMRWQVAWTTAVAEATRDGERRKKDIAKVKKAYTAAYRGRYDEEPILPEGWDVSIGRWLDLGTPMAIIDKAIAASVGRAIVREKRWNYFAGCCWSMIRDLGDRAKRIAEASGVAAETWSEKATRNVLDTTVIVWREMWMSSQGCDPEPGDEDLVRKNAAAIYPEEIDPGMLIRGAWDAAEDGSTEIGHYVYYGFDPAPPDPQEELPGRLRWSYFTGLTDYANLDEFSIDSDQWMAIAIQASAALNAGYTLDAVSIAAHSAGRSGELRLIKSLDTPWGQLAEEHAKTLILEVAATAHLDQAELDKRVEQARAKAAATRQAHEQHAAECDGTCAQCSGWGQEVPF